jgi:hypothetical protein
MLKCLFFESLIFKKGEAAGNSQEKKWPNAMGSKGESLPPTKNSLLRHRNVYKSE